MVYALINKNTNEIRYVGKTKRKLSDRLCGHVHEATEKEYNDPKSKWIRKTGKENIEIISIEESQNEDEAELWWMDYLEFLGCNLLNVVRYKVGGTNGRKLSEDKQKELLRKYKDPSIEVSKLCEEYDISNNTLTAIRRDWEVERVSRKPSNAIDFSEEEQKYIIRQYEENFVTDRELSDELNVSRQAIRRVLKEENVDFHDRSDYIEAGKINAPNEGMQIEEHVKKKLLRIYNETNNLRKACRETDMERHYDMIYNRLDPNRRGPTWVEQP